MATRLEDLKRIRAEIKALKDDESSLDKRYKDGSTFRKKVEEEIVRLKKESVKLEKEVTQESSQIVKNAKMHKKITDDVAKTQRNLSKTLSNRIGDLLKGNVQEALFADNSRKSTKAQLTLAKETAGFSDLLKNDENVSIRNKGKLLDIASDIKDGITEEEEIQDRLSAAGVDNIKQGHDYKQLLTDVAKKKSEEKEASEEEIKNQERRNMMLSISGVIMASLIAFASRFAKRLDAIGSKFGSLNQLGFGFRETLLDSELEVSKLGGGIDDVASITSTLASNFGMSLEEASRLSSTIFDTSKAIGLTTEEAANVFGILTQIADLSADEAHYLAEGAYQLARQNGVAPQQVMKDIAGSAETVAIWTKQGGENLIEAAVAARQMGLNIDAIAKSARGVLDFESSINAEIEASVLLGKQLNLQRARQLALDKDLVGFQKEIKNQLGGIGDFTTLNAFQQESVAKALSMSVTEVAKLTSNTKKLTLAGALAAGNFDDLHGQEALSNLSKLSGEFKKLSVTFLRELGPTFENILKSLNEFLSRDENITKISLTFQNLAKIIGFLAENLWIMTTLMGAMAGFSVGGFWGAGIGAVAGGIGGGLIQHAGSTPPSSIAMSQSTTNASNSTGGGISDADASRIGKAMASSMRFETTVTNRQQEIILDGTINQMAGRNSDLYTNG